MKFILAAVVVALCSSIALGEKARFDNYRVHTVKVTTEEQLTILQKLEEDNVYLFWSSPNGRDEADIMVAPHQRSDFSELVEYLNIEHFIKIENVQKLIDDESAPGQTRNLGWTSYSTFEQIDAWLVQQVNANPSRLQQEIIGYSTQNRPLRLVRYSEKAGNPIIFIEANIHAREWVTSATCTWFLNELITSTDSVVREMALNIDWHIICVANPDGFVFTHTSNRMWRKTRSSVSTSTCIGTDPNRNFDFHWMRGGASNNPCSDTYAGPAAWSEPETRAIRDYYARISPRTRAYISFHAFGQYLLLPYGHNTAPSERHANLMSVGTATINALSRRYGTSYVIGSTAVVLYVATGSSADWAYGTYHTNLAYTFEFRDIRNGPHGFLLPPEQILPNCYEVMDGLKALVQQARALNQLNP